MDPNLKKIRDSVIEHTLKLDDDQLALLLLIQLSRHQNLFKEHRNEILAMHPEDFLDNSIYQSSFSQFIGKKITISSLSTHFNIPKESMLSLIHI